MPQQHSLEPCASSEFAAHAKTVFANWLVPGLEQQSVVLTALPTDPRAALPNWAHAVLYTAPLATLLVTRQMILLLRLPRLLPELEALVISEERWVRTLTPRVWRNKSNQNCCYTSPHRVPPVQFPHNIQALREHQKERLRQPCASPRWLTALPPMHTAGNQCPGVLTGSVGLAPQAQKGPARPMQPYPQQTFVVASPSPVTQHLPSEIECFARAA